jgi:CheY-specific phosphatase CheX
MPNVLPQVALDAQKNFTQFASYMEENAQRVALFQIGPYQVGEAANAMVALTIELLEHRGYKVDVTLNVLTATPGPSGAILGAIAMLVVRAPAIVAPGVAYSQMQRGAPFDP